MFRYLNNETPLPEKSSFKVLGILQENVFPNQGGNWPDLISEFKNEWMTRLLPLENDEARRTSLLFLCKKYLSNIGCNADYAHISLFEHLKVTSAIADSLARGAGDGFLLAGVGLDNIQGFCYDIVSSKAAKSLKGRSFFLQMLMDTICQDIISHPNIQGGGYGHILYARGGKAFIILPDTQAVRTALDSIHEELVRQIWNRHHLGLYIFLQYTDFALTSNDQTSIWRALEEKIRQEKNSRYKQMLVNSFDRFHSNRRRIECRQ
ncbi:MAG: hypothetical protein IPH12_07560 [Saprospirales bacterium]|nr:hypothetical protein [Saprospirales bacterium]